MAEARLLIDDLLKVLPPPPAATRTGTGDRERQRSLGQAGRRGSATSAIALPDAGTMQLLQNLLFALGWDRARLDLFLHSPKSPVRHEIRTLADANKIIWVLKSMLRRRRPLEEGRAGEKVEA